MLLVGEIMSWTNKHQDFAAKNGWWQSAINVGNYLYTRMRSNEPMEIEFDSDKFNRRMQKVRGKKYHRTTIPKAVKHLAEHSQGLIIIMRDYGKGVFRLRIFPLSYLTENRSSTKDSSHRAAAENPLYSESLKKNQEEVLQQQQKYINKIDLLLKKIGLEFDADALQNIYRLSGKSISRVSKSIELLLYRNNKKKIPKPHGFIIDCLKKRWCDGFDIYYEPDLPTFQFKGEIQSFVNNICASLDIPSSGRIRRGKSSDQKKYVPQPAQTEGTNGGKGT